MANHNGLLLEKTIQLLNLVLKQSEQQGSLQVTPSILGEYHDLKICSFLLS